MWGFEVLGCGVWDFRDLGFRVPSFGSELGTFRPIKQVGMPQIRPGRPSIHSVLTRGFRSLGVWVSELRV